MNRLPNNVTIHTIESGFAEVRYWGNSIGYVERLKPRYWIGTDRFGRSITPYGETTRLEAVWALCRVIRGPRS